MTESDARGLEDSPNDGSTSIDTETPCYPQGTERIDAEEPWKDESRLRSLYFGGGCSMQEVADHFDVSARTIQYWMDKFEIDRRSASQTLRRGPATYSVNGDGYPTWQSSYDGRNDQVYIHRLLAVAEYGFDAVCGSAIHHRNGLKWDNRPSNIELLDQTDHVRRPTLGTLVEL